MPSTRTSPFWKGSSAFTVLISVDLPEPDGPQTTTTSPLSTFVVQSVSTWKLPYHFDTSRISIIAMTANSRYETSAPRKTLVVSCPSRGRRRAAPKAPA